VFVMYLFLFVCCLSEREIDGARGVRWRWKEMDYSSASSIFKNRSVREGKMVWVKQIISRYVDTQAQQPRQKEHIEHTCFFGPR
jgi:hypothetical protein